MSKLLILVTAACLLGVVFSVQGVLGVRLPDPLGSFTGAVTADDVSSSQVQVETALKEAQSRGLETQQASELLVQAKLLNAQGKAQAANTKLSAAQLELNHALGVRQSPRNNWNNVLAIISFSVAAATLLFYYARKSASAPVKADPLVPTEVHENEKFARYTTGDDVVNRLTREK